MKRRRDTPIICGHEWTDLHGQHHVCARTKPHRRHECRCYFQGGGWIETYDVTAGRRERPHSRRPDVPSRSVKTVID